MTSEKKTRTINTFLALLTYHVFFLFRLVLDVQQKPICLSATFYAVSYSLNYAFALLQFLNCIVFLRNKPASDCTPQLTIVAQSHLVGQCNIIYYQIGLGWHITSIRTEHSELTLTVFVLSIPNLKLSIYYFFFSLKN